MDFFKTITTVSELRPSYGTLLLAAFVIIALASTFKQGKGGVLRDIISLYMAIAINNFIPFLNLVIGGVKVEDNPWLKVGIFVVIFLLISFMLTRSSLGSLDTGRSSFLNTFLLAALGSGLLISTISVMLPPDIKKELAGISQFVFVNEVARFAWVIAPILLTVLIG